MANYTKKQVEMANKADVLGYIQARGIELRREASDKYRGVEHDSLIVTPSKNSWFWNSRDVHGTGALSFAIGYELAKSDMASSDKFLKGMEMVINTSVPEAKLETKRPKFDPASIKLGGDYVNVIDYLSVERGISIKTVSQLINQHKICVNKDDSLAIFPIEDNHGQIVGAMGQGFKTEGRRSYKQMLKNSDADFGWQFDSFDVADNAPHHLRIFESEIDAMSYYDLSIQTGHVLKDTRFVSMDGLKKQVVKNATIQLAQDLAKTDNKDFDVVICCDNDEAGDNFFSEMHSSFSKIKRHSPTKKVGKDWNDALKAAEEAK